MGGSTSATRPFPWVPVLAAGGLLLVLLGLCVSCVALSILFDEATPDERVSWLLCFLCFGVPLLVGGGASIAYSWYRHKQEHRAALQRVVLEVARAHDGQVTAANLALASTLSLEGAQDYLEQLASRGICRMEMTEEGTTCFIFDGARSGRASNADE